MSDRDAAGVDLNLVAGCGIHMAGIARVALTGIALALAVTAAVAVTVSTAVAVATGIAAAIAVTTAIAAPAPIATAAAVLGEGAAGGHLGGAVKAEVVGHKDQSERGRRPQGKPAELAQSRNLFLPLMVSEDRSDLSKTGTALLPA
jgi:hypothetical protein